MEISVNYITGEPSFDSLEVIKLCCNRSVDINSRIYGQAQIGRNSDLLFVKALYFESEPTATSSASVNLSLGEHTLSATVSFDGSAQLYLDDAESADKLSSYIISGEDLQGEYWGAVMMIPLTLLFDHFAISETTLPASLNGNILCRNSFVSLAVSLSEPADFIIAPQK